MASRGIFSQLTELVRVVVDAARSTPPADRTEPQQPTQRAPRLRREPAPSSDRVEPTYAPQRDGEPDPGEVVWAWVPYEEDASRGKDRPVLVLAVDRSRSGGEVVALMLTSKDHVGASSRDAADEVRHGRHWMDVGTGAWDAQRRPSEVRLDRVLHLPADAVRREGAALDERVFSRVADEASRLHGW